MEKNKNSEDFKKYSKDIETIKGLLMSVEEMPLVESWSFFSWGFLVLLGTLLHFITDQFLKYTIAEIFTRVWIPVFLTGSFFETVSWVRKMSKESLPLFSRTMAKFGMSLLGNITILIIIITILINSGSVNHLPVIIILLLSAFYLLYAQAAQSVYYIYAFFLILMGILLYLIEMDTLMEFIAVGLIYGLTFIAGGIAAYRKEKIQQHLNQDKNEKR